MTKSNQIYVLSLIISTFALFFLILNLVVFENLAATLPSTSLSMSSSKSAFASRLTTKSKTWAYATGMEPVSLSLYKLCLPFSPTLQPPRLVSPLVCFLVFAFLVLFSSSASSSLHLSEYLHSISIFANQSPSQSQSISVNWSISVSISLSLQITFISVSFSTQSLSLSLSNQLTHSLSLKLTHYPQIYTIRDLVHRVLLFFVLILGEGERQRCSPSFLFIFFYRFFLFYFNFNFFLKRQNDVVSAVLTAAPNWSLTESYTDKN